MGLVGGEIGYRLLKRISRNGENSMMDGSVYANRSKLEILLGEGVWGDIADKVVIDFGCGAGAEAIEMARRGARRVIGLDIQEDLLALARANAEQAGLDSKCAFVHSSTEKADVITAIDSFEHFSDPAGILDQMHGMLKPKGSVFASFGPTWYHPLGGHLFSVFPWAHLVFSESTLIRWRSDFKIDGATRFAEVAGGLNQMTIKRFEQIVGASAFRFASFEAIPIRRLRPIANRWTREFTTAIVRCRLTPK